jgi:hypothetical protein
MDLQGSVWEQLFRKFENLRHIVFKKSNTLNKKYQDCKAYM